MTTQVKMVTLTIDGRTVTVPASMTVLEAAREAGIFIPTLCAHPALKPFGACRVCLVQIEKGKGLPASCTSLVAEGMVVHTNNEPVVQIRKDVLELLLTEHPYGCLICHKNPRCAMHMDTYTTDTCQRSMAVALRCLTCPKNYRCELQETMDYVRVLDLRPPTKLRSDPIKRDFFIERDYNFCIDCARCVRVCNEVRDFWAIDLIDRGGRMLPGTAYDLPLDQSGCTFCGACVDVCPTNALMERKGRWDGLAQTFVETTCPECSVGCGLILEQKDGKLVRNQPNWNGPANLGMLCVKGRFGWDKVHDAERLTQPLIRRGGQLTPATWDEALSLIANNFEELRGDGFAVWGAPHLTNETAYLLQKFTRLVMQTNNIDYRRKPGPTPLAHGLLGSLGAPAMTISNLAIGDAKAIFVLGVNVGVSHPVTDVQIIRATQAGAKLIVVESQRSSNAKRAAAYLPIKPGAELALVAGMTRVLLDENLLDQEFVAAHCHGLDELQASLPSLDKAAAAAGVAAEQIAAAARLYARSGPAVIICRSALDGLAYTAALNRALANLALLTGNLGQPNAGLCPLPEGANAQGMADLGCLPDVLPGWQPAEDAEARERLAAWWGRDLPETEGLTSTLALEAASKGALKALWIVGQNPLLGAEHEAIRAALGNLDFLVVQDAYLTETARLAHVVLPGALFAEQDGTFTNQERRIQRVRRAVLPPGQALADWQIVCRVAEAMEQSGFEYRAVEGVAAEINRLVPLYAGATYERLEDEGLQWPVSDADGAGTPTLASDPEERYNLAPYDGQVTPPLPQRYPLLLRVPTNGHGPVGNGHGRLMLNPSDAARLGFAADQKLRVVARGGAVSAPAAVDTDTLPGTISLPPGLIDALGSLVEPLPRAREDADVRYAAVRVEAE